MTVKPANYKYRRTKGTSLTGGKRMGLVYAEIDLTNEDDLALNRHGYLPKANIRRIRCRALVDSGSYDLVLNEEITKQLGLLTVDKDRVRLADERMLRVDMVGPVRVQFETRTTIVKAVVLPGISEVLLGAIPMEGLHVFVDPAGERLIVNPDSSDTPSSQIMRLSLSV